MLVWKMKFQEDHCNVSICYYQKEMLKVYIVYMPCKVLKGWTWNPIPFRIVPEDMGSVFGCKRQLCIDTETKILDQQENRIKCVNQYADFHTLIHRHRCMNTCAVTIDVKNC